MQKFKIIVSCTLAGFIILSGWTAYRRAKRYVTQLEPFANSGEPLAKGERNHSKPGPSPNRPSFPRFSMAAAFESGRLPDPLPVPTGDLDKAAEDLANKIAAKDEQSTAALLTALQMAGFSVRDPQGELYLKPAGASQGMAFDAFSVAAMSKLYGEGIRLNFSRFGTTLATTLPGFKDVSLAKLLLDGIRTDAQSEKTQLRFWARLIAALGKRAEKPYDLTTENIDPNVVALDMVQFSLIIQRLAGDGVAFSKQPQAHAALFQEEPIAHPVLVETNFHQSRQPRLLRIADESKSSQEVPCSADEMTATVTDLGALLESIGFGKLADILKENGREGVEKFAEAAAKINGLLMILKLVWIQSALTVDVRMDEAELVRTKNTTPGDLRHLTAQVKIDMGKWQELNCFRLITGAVGVDIGNIPKNAEGAGVDWILVEGGDTRGALGTLENFWSIAKLEQVDTDAIVGLKPPKEYEDKNSFYIHQTAGKDGISNMDVEGTPQKKDMTSSKLSPVTKEMAIQIGVRWKNANTPEKLFGDFVDLLGSASAVLSDDPSAPINVAIETIYRCHCFTSPIFRFQVIDWEECSGGWTGNISYTSSMQSVHNSSARDYYNTEASELNQHLDVRVHGNASDQEDPDLMRATFSGSAHSNRFGQTHWVNGCTATTEVKMSASGGGDTSVVIGSPEGSGTYSIRVRDVSIKSESSSHGTVHCQNITPPPDEQGTGTWGQSIPQLTADVDPKEPGVLRGSKTFPNILPGGETVVSWNLQQCR